MNLCAHGCGHSAGNDGYCDDCYADQCLIGPDGTCRYTTDDEIFQGVVFAGQKGIFDRDEDARMGVCYHLDDGRFLNVEMTPTGLRMFISVNLESRGEAIALSPEAWWDAIYKGDV